jgi:Mce-associated membrane protein
VDARSSEDVGRTSQGGAAERSALASPWLTAVLVLAAVVLAALVVLQVEAAERGADPAARAPAPVVERAERERVLSVAARTAEAVLTYHHGSFDQDVERASATLEPDFAAEHVAAMERVRRVTVRDEIDQEALAVSSGLVSATDGRAEVLVFVNQETTSGRTGARRFQRDRVVVSLVREQGAWTVAGVTSLG